MTDGRKGNSTYSKGKDPACSEACTGRNPSVHSLYSTLSYSWYPTYLVLGIY